MPIGTSDGQHFEDQWDHAEATTQLRPAEPSDLSSRNMDQAMIDLDLNPQEKALYQQHLWNLNGPGGVDNADGSRSTLYVSSHEVDGRHYVIPNVFNGKILSPDEGLEVAKGDGIDTYPSYETADTANERYMAMHAYMEKDTMDYMNNRDSMFPTLADYPELRGKHFESGKRMLGRSGVELDPLHTGDLPVRANKYDDSPTPQALQRELDSGKPTAESLKYLEQKMVHDEALMGLWRDGRDEGAIRPRVFDKTNNR